MRTRLWFALHRAGIPTAFPVRKVILTPDDADARARAADASRAARRAALERVSIFAPLTSEEHDRLAEGMSRALFAAGEAIVLQGAAGHHLYVLTKGRAWWKLPRIPVYVDITLGPLIPIGAEMTLTEQTARIEAWFRDPASSVGLPP